MYKSIINNRFHSRRQFLKGLGSSFLLLPPLISLMPKSLQAQAMTPIRRSVFYVGTLGVDQHQLYPDDSVLTHSEQRNEGININVQPLKSFTDPVSRVIDTSITDNAAIRDKMNLIKGLSLTGGLYQGHNRGVLSGTHSGAREPIYGKSIDVILENSPSVYGPNEAIAKKSARIVFDRGSSSFSYDRVNGKRITSSFQQGDTNLFNYLLSGLSEEGQTVNSLRQSNQLSIVDRVLEDLHNLKNHSSLSYDDGVVLERFVDGVNDVSSRLQANSTICQQPNLDLESTTSGNSYQFPWNDKWGVEDVEKMYDNLLEIITLSFQCDLTRVVYIGSTYYNPSSVAPNGLHHDGTSEQSADGHQYGLKKMYRLAEKLDAIQDSHSAEGTLLDNSLLLWTNELGAWTTSHNTFSIPTVTFGSQGGQFNTGYYANYEQPRTLRGFKPGRPYKQLLQSIMLSMGMTKSEYSQFGDGNGFGEFKEDINQFGKYDPGVFSPYKNEHNDPLPFIFKNA